MIDINGSSQWEKQKINEKKVDGIRLLKKEAIMAQWEYLGLGVGKSRDLTLLLDLMKNISDLEERELIVGICVGWPQLFKAGLRVSCLGGNEVENLKREVLELTTAPAKNGGQSR